MILAGLASDGYYKSDVYMLFQIYTPYSQMADKMFAAFLQRSPTLRSSDASETYKIILFPEDIRVPFDCKQQIATKH